MEDKYFDKKLRDILENPPPFEPDSGAITDMKRRLDSAQPSNRRSALGLWWLLPLLVLPFLFGSIFFYFKYQNINQKLDDITLQLTHFQKDTISRNYVTYHYDTIYNVIYKDIIVERHFEKAKTLPSILNAGYGGTPRFTSLSGVPSAAGYGNLGNRSLLQPYPYQYPGLGMLNALVEKGVESSTFQAEEEIDWVNRKLENIDYRSLSELRFRPRYIDLEEKLNDVKGEYKKPKVNPLYYFIPKGFNVGVTVMPTVRGQANSNSYSGSNLGISTALEFYNDIELNVGVERLAFGFELGDPSNNVSGYPILDPENPGDVLNEFYVDFSYLQIPISFKKYLRKNKDFQPFFGFGMVAQKPLKQKFRYEYVDGANEYYLNQSLTDGDFSINNLRTNLGLRYRFFDHFSAQTEVMYQHAFDQGTGEYFALRYWALNFALKYHFD